MQITVANCLRKLCLVAYSLIIQVLLIMPIAEAAQVTRHNETVSGLQGWRIQGGYIEIQLNPLKPEQTSAFYLGRGFSEQIAERIAQSCVYQIVIKNISTQNDAKEVSIDLSDWRLIDQRGESSLITKQAWREKWLEMGASKAAITAFGWATYPWQQVFSPAGDSGWGMILFGPIEGDSFALTTHWRVDGEPQQQTVEHLLCPKK